MPTPLTLKLTAPAVKCSLVLAPAALISVHVPDGVPSVAVTVQVERRILTASIAAKSVRRAIVAIGESGPDNIALLLQGKLVGDVIEDAGLSAMPKAPKVDKAAVANGQERPVHAD
jgi:hypothetical protein